MPITRFAPSPTGPLHLGHALSALFAAREAGSSGRFLLRIEDLDVIRCKPVFMAGIEADLAWLGLDWPKPVRRQSAHLAFYQARLATLQAEGLLYPCFCTRTKPGADTIANAPHATAGHPATIYLGTCRHIDPAIAQDRCAAGLPHALRLDAAAAIARTGPLVWRDLDQGIFSVDPAAFGDVVLARKDIGVSYHLAVTLDDAAQGVDCVTRGIDLLSATPIHRLLQGVFDLPVPIWRHHPLLHDAHGNRLAKRAGSQSLRQMRDAGIDAATVRRMAGFPD